MITVVAANSGRCGTSLMMQMLQAAGVPLYWNRHPNCTTINPHGHFEVDGRKESWTDDYARFVARESEGKAVKMFWSKLDMFVAACDEQNRGLQFIHMHRDPECMFHSQTVMLREENRMREKADPKRSIEGIGRSDREMAEFLSHRRHIDVWFNELFTGEAQRRVASFLMLDDEDAAVTAMNACVHPDLWHFKPGQHTDPSTVYVGRHDSGISNPKVKH